MRLPVVRHDQPGIQWEKHAHTELSLGSSHDMTWHDWILLHEKTWVTRGINRPHTVFLARFLQLGLSVAANPFLDLDQMHAGFRVDRPPCRTLWDPRYIRISTARAMPCRPSVLGAPTRMCLSVPTCSMPTPADKVTTAAEHTAEPPPSMFSASLLDRLPVADVRQPNKPSRMKTAPFGPSAIYDENYDSGAPREHDLDVHLRPRTLMMTSPISTTAGTTDRLRIDDRRVIRPSPESLCNACAFSLDTCKVLWIISGGGCPFAVGD
eukprot:COSAG02_NODE_11852_length_1642_cov_18.889825_1_plen_266_part_00